MKLLVKKKISSITKTLDKKKSSISEILEKRITEISIEHYYKPEFFSFRSLLVFISKIYALITSVRVWLYKKNIIKAKNVPFFVISIGNIVAGGSGKTPMTLYVAEMLKEKGFKPVVLSRGYGGSIEKTDSNVVAGDGKNVFFSPDEVGDEPFMMASRRSFPVVVGKNRFKGAIKAMEMLFSSDSQPPFGLYASSDSQSPFGLHASSDSQPPSGLNSSSEPQSPSDALSKGIMILDDGFQHIRLKRDLDILLMDYTHPLGNGRLLPVGRLREKPDAASRADIVVFTRCRDITSLHGEPSAPCSTPASSQKTSLSLKSNLPNIKGLTHINGLPHINDLPCFMTTHRPSLYCFINKEIFHDDKNFSLPQPPTTIENLTGRRALLFSGIADNRFFRQTVTDLGIYVLEHLEFNDHHMYKSGDICQINELCYTCGADLLITTEKDYARLNYCTKWPLDIAVLGVRIEFVDSAEKDTFNNIILNAVNNCSKQV
ncbi:putative Tetraacyldisaccharide 4'-kinase [Desulfamplus magnetovallimortis]|uniref:Tetraacyldisaccharide 4'-kinase n=1 Tax=Desulfamplus magnetovallimortis TaxID=1246637 RepID=A0A1W1H8E1_9BACT|nr:tetraacyldisaccharide 4'-kinase [Desulfamplus magnetovallimortis]SLM28747.1 putative Tetraacyldisaccharide 4'-kinase [Desulfamplus magnetovallimortis]